MKTFCAILILVFGFITPASLQAQSGEEKKLAETVESLRQAMIRADSIQLEELTSPKLTYGHSSGVIDSRKEFIDKLTSGRSKYITMELSDQTIDVSDRVAIVRHTLRADIMDGGKAGQISLKVLLVFEKTGRKWKLIARQAVKI